MTKSRKKVILTCLDCGKEIIGGSHMSRHVQKEHGYETYDEYKLKHSLVKTDDDLKNEGAVSCKLCGLLSHDLTSHITRIHKMKTSQYENEYGDFRSKKYLENQSELIKGEKNPGYNHNGRFSSLSKNFIHYDEEKKKQTIEKISESNKTNGNNSTTLIYWLNQGYTPEEAQIKLSERQKTFTLEKCIEKYGEEEGPKVWAARQEKWLKNTQISWFSKISQKLFWEIYQKLIDNTSVYFAELGEDRNPDYSGRNNEYVLNLGGKVVLPDFYDEKTKKIIEFDGTYWHGKHIIKVSNPLRDLERDEIIKKNGYKVLHIREENYRKSPDLTVTECLEFLYG